MNTINKIFTPIAFLMLLPFIYTAGYVHEQNTPNHAKKHVSVKPVVLWNISKHDNWTKEDKAAALVYLYGK